MTKRSSTKQHYSPEMAQERVRQQAGHFVSMIHDILEAQPRRTVAADDLRP